jgi:hypothetical protein
MPLQRLGARRSWHSNIAKASSVPGQRGHPDAVSTKAVCGSALIDPPNSTGTAPLREASNVKSPQAAFRRFVEDNGAWEARQLDALSLIGTWQITSPVKVSVLLGWILRLICDPATEGAVKMMASLGPTPVIVSPSIRRV